MIRRIGTIPSTAWVRLSGVRTYSGTPGPFPKSKADIVADRDFFVSVLEASATKRDAKGYLQKYASTSKSHETQQKRLQAQRLAVQAAAVNAIATSNHQELVLANKPAVSASAVTPTLSDSEALHVALVQLRAPQLMDEETKNGVAKSLSQLRTLGLLCLVVVDCGPDATNKERRAQCERLGYAVNQFRGPGARVVENVVGIDTTVTASQSPFKADGLFIKYPRDLEDALRHSVIPIMPALASDPETFRTVDAAPESLMVALAKYFSKMQMTPPDDDLLQTAIETVPAIIEKVIILDANGGLPYAQGSRFAHRFVNLEQEYTNILRDLQSGLEAETKTGSVGPSGYRENESHIRNLKVVRDTLAMLPSTSSALITTPMAAANVGPSSSTESSTTSTDPKVQIKNKTTNKPLPLPQPFGIAASVRTRKSLNPLIHNLLTDKPIYSSSLPFDKIASPSFPSPLSEAPARMGTLVKRGTPVTIYPSTSWSPPGSTGRQPPRLTDSSLDLARLAYLIKDSFGRDLDIDEYLARLDHTLAGVVIAGSYEGAAILTWECPEGLSEQEALETGRFVPYLDKFAVCKKSQGTGGVADILFNSMTRDCFPGGVCWRSRQNNPVNKWYFERSQGTMKLPGTEWTMFWTTPNLQPGMQRLKDYESICRKIQPTWMDMKEQK